jgi:hypothetical protein
MSSSTKPWSGAGAPRSANVGIIAIVPARVRQRSVSSPGLRWIVEALQRSGADPYVGLKLFAIFTAAGLPPPALDVQASIGAGPDHAVYAAVTGLMRTLLPTMEALGVATADEVDVDTLASRISDEAVAAGATLIWMSLIGAFSRKPAEQ